MEGDTIQELIVVHGPELDRNDLHIRLTAALFNHAHNYSMSVLYVRSQSQEPIAAFALNGGAVQPKYSAILGSQLMSKLQVKAGDKIWISFTIDGLHKLETGQEWRSTDLSKHQIISSGNANVNDTTGLRNEHKLPSSLSRRPLAPPGRQPQVLNQTASSLSHQEKAYKLVLLDVVEIARRTKLPSATSGDPQPLPRYRNENLMAAFATGMSSGLSREVRDSKIGAAGELFIFEFLKSSLELPGFSLDNWPSGLRADVRLLDDYKDITPFHGLETTDIVYEDTRGLLTQNLISKRHLDEQQWDGKRPVYYIEVKTTTGPWDDPFYVSKAQYERMQSLCQKLIDPIPSIYVIARVYNLGQPSNTNFRLYINPYGAQQSGMLNFTAEKFSVRPSWTTPRPGAVEDDDLAMDLGW